MSEFDHAYFQSLYGESRRQTWADRSRDHLVERWVRAFAPPVPLAQPGSRLHPRVTHAATGPAQPTLTAGSSPPVDGRPGEPSDALLDIGCGFGFLLERFAPDYRLFGVDISAHAVAVATQRLPEASFAVADVQQGLPFPGPFRAVLLINVLEHLSDPAAAAAVLHAVIAPGGLCVVHLPTINNACNRLYYDRSYAKDPTHVFRPSGRQVTRLFEVAGFEAVAESYAPHWPGRLWRALQPFPPFLGAYRRR